MEQYPEVVSMIWVSIALCFLTSGSKLIAHLSATRIVASWYLMHQDAPSFPPVNFDAFLTDSDETNEHVDVQDDHYKLVRDLGAASAVLLKNKNGALPLGKKDRSIVLVGSGAGPGRSGPNEFGDQGGAISGVLAMGWGSGTANFTYLVSVSLVRFVRFV